MVRIVVPLSRIIGMATGPFLNLRKCVAEISSGVIDELGAILGGMSRECRNRLVKCCGNHVVLYWAGCRSGSMDSCSLKGLVSSATSSWFWFVGGLCCSGFGLSVVYVVVAHRTYVVSAVEYII